MPIRMVNGVPVFESRAGEEGFAAVGHTAQTYPVDVMVQTQSDEWLEGAAELGRAATREIARRHLAKGGE